MGGIWPMVGCLTDVSRSAGVACRGPVVRRPIACRETSLTFRGAACLVGLGREPPVSLRRVCPSADSLRARERGEREVRRDGLVEAFVPLFSWRYGVLVPRTYNRAGLLIKEWALRLWIRRRSPRLPPCSCKRPVYEVALASRRDWV